MVERGSVLHRKSPTLYLMNTTPQAGAGVSADRQFGLAGRMRRRPVRGSASGSDFAGFRQLQGSHVVSFTPMCHWTDHNVCGHVYATSPTSGNTITDQEISGTQACDGRVAALRDPCLC